MTNEIAYQYQGPDGDVVEATPHEFVTRFKNLGYVRVLPQAEATPELEEVTPEVQHEAVEVATAEQEPVQVPEEQKPTPPREADGRRNRG